MKLEKGRIIAGRYKVIELIGVGGTANVYCAEDTRLERRVSLKVLKEDFVDAQFIKKFSKEARAAAKISHINIANVYDVGNDGDIHYIIMEYVDGFTLKDIIKSKAPFTNEEVLGISIQIANALEVAHKKEIVHRDIKPENILVTKEGAIKVTDFGIARATTSNTITTDTMGSVHYFSPEQARGGYVDFKSDIYSLGIIMYEMITGKRPFDGDGVVQLAMKHVNEPLPDIREINKNVSDSLLKVILKATAKNQDSRYKSAKDLNIDLKKALSDDTGIFVKENNYEEDFPTIVIKPEDIEEINKRIEEEKGTMGYSETKAERIIDEKIEKYDENKEYDDEYDDEEYDEEEYDNGYYKNNKNGSKAKEILVTLFAILTSLLVIAIISAGIFMWINTKNESTVPNFIGATWEEAVAMSKEKQIYIANVKEEYSDDVEKGGIASQEIAAGTEIEKGKTVNVTISLGDGKFILDDFIGKDIVQVYEEVKDKDIYLSEEYVYDESVEIGKVVRQEPEPREKVKKGVKVTLYISRGEEDKLVVVPDIVGYSEASAKATIENAGLSINSVKKADSDTVKEGNVISQSVRSGSEVLEHTSIGIVISTGTKETTTTTETTTQTTTEQIETTTVPTIKKETLVINPTIEEGVESVAVKVIKIEDDSTNIIWSNTHNVSELPLEITVSGDKPAQFEIYIDNVLVEIQEKSFS